MTSLFCIILLYYCKGNVDIHICINIDPEFQSLIMLIKYHHGCLLLQISIDIVEPEVTFPSAVYNVPVLENLTPPFQLLDLNSSAEVKGLSVIYSFTEQTQNKGRN